MSCISIKNIFSPAPTDKMTAMMKKTSSEAKDMISKVRRCLFSVTPDAPDLFYHFKVELNENKNKENLPKIYNIH